METRIAIVGIIVYDKEAVAKINALLHEYAKYIIGRMGLPYKEKKVSVITVVMDAPNDTIGAISGKLGRIKDITVKVVYSKAGL